MNERNEPGLTIAEIDMALLVALNPYTSRENLQSLALSALRQLRAALQQIAVLEAELLKRSTDDELFDQIESWCQAKQITPSFYFALDVRRRSILAETQGDAAKIPEGADHRDPCAACGYTAWRISADTGSVLYCEVCDQRSQARDFRIERDQAHAENARLSAALAAHREALTHAPCVCSWLCPDCGLRTAPAPPPERYCGHQQALRTVCTRCVALADPTGTEAAARVQELQRTLGLMVVLALHTTGDDELRELACAVPIEYVDGEPHAALTRDEGRHDP